MLSNWIHPPPDNVLKPFRLMYKATHIRRCFRTPKSLHPLSAHLPLLILLTSPSFVSCTLAGGTYNFKDRVLRLLRWTKMYHASDGRYSTSLILVACPSSVSVSRWCIHASPNFSHFCHTLARNMAIGSLGCTTRAISQIEDKEVGFSD